MAEFVGGIIGGTILMWAISLGLRKLLLKSTTLNLQSSTNVACFLAVIVIGVLASIGGMFGSTPAKLDWVIFYTIGGVLAWIILRWSGKKLTSRQI